MKITSYVSGTVAVLALGSLGATWWWSHQSASTPRRQARSAVLIEPTVARSEREMEALQQQLSSLRAEVENVRDNLAKSAGGGSSADPAVAAVAAPLSSEAQERRWLDHVRELEQAFRAEPVNPEWSTEMVNKIRSEASDSKLSGLVLEIECHSQSCRLAFADAAPRQLDRAIERLIQRLSGDLQNASVGHNGDLSAPKPATLYLSRARPEDSIPLVARE